MREILFRGQTRRKGEIIRINGTPVDSKWVYGGVFQGKGGYSIIYDYKSADKFPVYTDTVGQYIGLNDKNGNKIFEGDVCHLWCVWGDGEIEDWHAVIKFGDPNNLLDWGWQLKRISGSSRVNKEILMWVGNEDMGVSCEIIGNIHDNPELVELDCD